MADVEVNVNVNATKKSAETFAENIANGLQKSMGKLGLGSALSVNKGGQLGPGVSEGVAAGLVAGGVVGFLGIIAEAVKNLPVITGIMKLLGMIITVLLLPLIPILKPVLLLLGLLARLLIKWMNDLGLIGGKKGDTLLGGKNAIIDVGEVNSALGKLAIGLFNAAFDIGQAIGNVVFNIGKGALDLGKNIGQWLYDKVIYPIGTFIGGSILGAFDWIKDIGTKIWDIISSPFQWIADKISGLFGISSSGSSSKGSSGGSSGIVGNSAASVVNTIVQATSMASNVVSSIAKTVTPLVSTVSKIVTTVSNVASSIGSFVKKLFTGKQLGGPISNEGVYYLHKGERVLSATERKNVNSGGMNITLNIQNPVISQKSDIKDLVNQIEDKLKSGIRRRVSYGPRNF